MPDKLKDMFFTEDSLTQFANRIKKSYPKFNKKKFMTLLFDDNWKSLELKAKMRHTTLCLNQTLPSDFKRAVKILTEVAPDIKGFESMTLPDYVELFGLNYWTTSLKALGHFTKYSSSEFAIRPFLDKDPERVMKYMLEWAGSKNENQRRFASEGCRPRLPWAMALPKFKKDPSLIIPILENLKDDKSEFVRRSVANNLNDISKDNPELMLKVCKKWIGKSPRTDWIIKHACRTLLKAGDKRALMLFGYGNPATIEIRKFKADKEVKIGDALNYSFEVINKDIKSLTVRIEYAITYVKSTGKTSRKVFKITENDYKPGKYFFNKKQSFANMSTRKHFPGDHSIDIIINGEVKKNKKFNVAK